MKVLLLLAFVGLTSSAVPHKGHNHERTSDGAFSPRDAGHFQDEEHNGQFDHEAILGSAKEAVEFDQLPPEEAKRRLRILLTKMDRNGDEKIERIELQQWIVRSFRSLSKEESAERFEDSDTDKDGQITWLEYATEEFQLDDDEEDEANAAAKVLLTAEELENKLASNPDSADEYNIMMEDKLLFRAADRDGDGRLNRGEFLSFTHPEEDESMHETVINQALKEKDSDGDGRLSFQEYVGERGKDQNKEWLVGEKDRFDEDLDKNKDGQLDRSEIVDWMIPSNDDIANDEVDHLFAGADDDVDGVLSFDEVSSSFRLAL